MDVRRAPVDRFPYHLVYLETPEFLWEIAVARDSYSESAGIRRRD